MFHVWKTADLEVRHPCILSGITYVWQSTAPRSRCSWPERRSLRSSPSTGWTSTRLSPPQRSPPRLPAGPPSSNRAESLEPTKLFKLWQLPLILSEDQLYRISNYLPLKRVLLYSLISLFFRLEKDEVWKWGWCPLPQDDNRVRSKKEVWLCIVK